MTLLFHNQLPSIIINLKSLKSYQSNNKNKRQKDKTMLFLYKIIVSSILKLLFATFVMD